ncbi:MAG: HAD-IC family P-type ATPase [Clostridia bacterium]|nr:HAD-IC family P-type ATPase [Clostridia bacterium]
MIAQTASNESYAGLNDGEIARLREQYGENILSSGKGVSPISILLEQFKSPLVYVVLAAALVSLIMREVKDFAIIMAVVLFDVVLGFVQEYETTKTYESLKGLVKPIATVVRGGVRREVEVRELVPGDVVILNAGDKIPADGRILESVRLTVSEAILTGESESVPKRHGDTIYMGTTILAGHAVMEVSGIGPRTELGKIAASLSDTAEEKTPLQRRLEEFSHQLTKIVIVLTLALFAAGVLAGKPALDMVRVAIILAIAAIPEGLLIAVTVILVLGMKKVLKRKGLVKRMLAVETLGSVTVICTDKTGTLTEGHMKVTSAKFEDETMALKILALNNNLEDSLETSLWDYSSGKVGAGFQDMVKESPRLAEEPFSSETKHMKTINRIGSQAFMLLKGAPEAVVSQCTLSDEGRKAALELADTWADRGLKLIGLAYAPVSVGDEQAFQLESGDLALEEFEQAVGASNSGYTWAGLVGIEDPVREGVREAVETCAKAGIRVKMITGDHRRTALKVAREVGLDRFGSDVVEGTELDLMDDATLKQRVQDAIVFSRISPHQKLRIVAALQDRGEVVAMIGDGVNDAPALKKSNIGVVVGTATEVAKETADLVLLDSNFATIVGAIEEGRVVFQNIKKVVSYTLSNSFAEILLVFTAMLLGWPAPVAVAQILWVHLICDGPVDIVLGFEPKEDGIMSEPPRPASEPILGRMGMGLIAGISTSAALGILVLFGHYWRTHNDIALARTVAFETLAVISLVYVFAYRSMRRSMFTTGSITSNKPLLASVIGGFILAFAPHLIPVIGKTLGVVALGSTEWAEVFGISIFLLLMVEVVKLITLHRHVRVPELSQR